MALPARQSNPDTPDMGPVTTKALMLQIERLIEALAQPMLRPEITLNPEVRVSPNVNPPEVHLSPQITVQAAAALPPAEVYVDGPIVNVSAPEVTLAPQMTVAFMPKSAETEVVRDGNGYITKTTTRYTY